MSTRPTHVDGPASSLASSAAFRTFAVVFAIATPVIYVACEMQNWPLFTYHPGTNRVDWFYAPAVRDEGPAMYWYGWTATTLIGVGVLAGSRHDAAGTADRQDPAVADLDRAVGGGAGPDLRAEVLLALVVGCGRCFMAARRRARLAYQSRRQTCRSVPWRLPSASAVACGAPAFAGGDDYDAMNDTEGAGPAYFGFVRDQRGSPVSDAQVMLRPKIGEPVTIKTNVLGLYRSHVTKDVTPDDVAGVLREDRLQAGPRLSPHAAGRQGHVHRDRMHLAAAVEASTAACSDALRSLR